jgi:hypothetical protein
MVINHLDAVSKCHSGQTRLILFGLVMVAGAIESDPIELEELTNV